MKDYVYVFIFSFFCVILPRVTYSQTSQSQIDSVFLEYIWNWSLTDTLASTKYFQQMYTYPLYPSKSYRYKGYRVYHFPDRCADNVIVVDTVSLCIVDMCVGECDWLYTHEK